MEVSWNGGTPKSSVSFWDVHGWIIINQPFSGFPIYGKPLKKANSYVKLHIADFEFQFSFIDQWEFQDPKMGYCTIFQAIFFWDIPWNLGLTHRPFFYGIGTSVLHRFRRWIHQSHGLKKCANVTGTAQGFYHYKSHQKRGADLSIRMIIRWNVASEHPEKWWNHEVWVGN